MFNLKRFILISKQLKRINSAQFCRTQKTSASALQKSGIFGKYLIYTNVVSGGVLMFLGDIIEQEIEFRRQILHERYDTRRLFNMTMVGISQGPLHHYFYIYLHKLLPRRNLGSIFKKIMVDQFVMSPVCIVAFFYTLCLLQRDSVQACTQELKQKYLEVYMVDWIVWPPTQFLNFYLIPVKYQVLYVNFVTMLYNVFLSYIKFKDVD